MLASEREYDRKIVQSSEASRRNKIWREKNAKSESKKKTRIVESHFAAINVESHIHKMKTRNPFIHLRCTRCAKKHGKSSTDKLFLSQTHKHIQQAHVKCNKKWSVKKWVEKTVQMRMNFDEPKLKWCGANVDARKTEIFGRRATKRW